MSYELRVLDYEFVCVEDFLSLRSALGSTDRIRKQRGICFFGSEHIRYTNSR